MKTLKSLIRYLLGCRKKPIVIEETPRIVFIRSHCPLCGKFTLQGKVHVDPEGGVCRGQSGDAP